MFYSRTQGYAYLHSKEDWCNSAANDFTLNEHSNVPFIFLNPHWCVLTWVWSQPAKDSIMRIVACVWGSHVYSDDDPMKRAWQAICWHNQRKQWNWKGDFPRGLLSTGKQTENVSLIIAFRCQFTEILNWRLLYRFSTHPAFPMDW